MKEHGGQMKKIRTLNRDTLIIISILFCTLLLVGCSEEKSIISKELVFLEKTTDFGYPLFIFESIEDRKYYSIEVTNWEYDNVKFESGEILEVDTRKDKDSNGLGRGLFHIFIDFAQATNLEVNINGEWTSLFEMTNYTKSK